MQKIVKQYKYFYIRTSAKDATGLEEAFKEIAKLVKEQLKLHKNDEILSQQFKQINREPLEEKSRFPCCQKAAN